jgi:hypothetical protein
MTIKQASRCSNWRVTHWPLVILLIGASCAVTTLTVPTSARAEGFLDFLFGAFQDHSSPRPQQQNGYPSAPPSSVGRIAPAPLGQESINDLSGSTGHLVAFCVRLCDGHNFPMEQMVNGTPVETCRAICPYSRTKVFFGSEIGAAVAQDGQRYTALNTAFLYRKQLVGDCTCNGRDAFGLSTFDVKRDPTLRPGDIVSTKEGLLTYTGRSSEGSAFMPVNPATLPVDIRPASSLPRHSSSMETADDEPGTIVQSAKHLSPNAPLR